MPWPYNKKDVNYYTKLKLINNIKKFVEAHVDYDVPIQFNPPIIYDYRGGKVLILNILHHKYMSQFKREFTPIICHLDNGTVVRLTELKNKHVLEIFKSLSTNAYL